MSKTWTIDAMSTEPIIAWRVWRVIGVDSLGDGLRRPRLAPATDLRIPHFWQPKQRGEALCPKPLHEAPWPECSCGIYGLSTRELAEEALEEYRANWEYDWALGRVSLWGRVIECETGWRAQYAYPYEITVYTNKGWVADDLRSMYAIDVERRSMRQGRPVRTSEEAKAASREARTQRAEKARQEAAEREALVSWLARWNDLVTTPLVFTDEELLIATTDALTDWNARVRANGRWNDELMTSIWAGNVADHLASWRPNGATRGDSSVVGRRLASLARRGLVERDGPKWETPRWRPVV